MTLKDQVKGAKERFLMSWPSFRTQEGDYKISYDKVKTFLASEVKAAYEKGRQDAIDSRDKYRGDIDS